MKEKTDTIKQELFTSLNERIRAMGEIAIIWNYPLEEKDRYAEQVLQRVPDIPNVAASMAEEYILYIINAETVELQLIDTDQKILRDIASIHVSYPSKLRLTIGPGILSREKAILNPKDTTSSQKVPPSLDCIRARRSRYSRRALRCSNEQQAWADPRCA